MQDYVREALTLMVFHVPGVAAHTPAAFKGPTSIQAPPPRIMGPSLWEFVPVWLRKEHTGAMMRTLWESVGDTLIISLPSLRARCGASSMTNRNFIGEILRKIQRIVIPGKRAEFNALTQPFRVHAIRFDPSRRGVLKRRV